MNWMKRTLLVVAATLFCATPAMAGNIALTGHDDDYHCFYEGNSNGACTQLGQLVNFARAGSANPSLPVLVFDQNPGSQGPGNLLTSVLTSLGISYTAIGSVGAINAGLFNPATFSAFVVASQDTCGGCDNSAAFVAAIAAQSAAITAFFNAGGGVVGLAGALNASYYNFVPQTVSGFGTPNPTGYFATGPCYGLQPVVVNGDPTHNFFFNPGTNGVSPLYCVTERNDTTGLPAETMLLAGGTITTGVITTGAVPEPATLSLLGLGLVGLAARQIRRRK